jgi:hypothetical protein
MDTGQRISKLGVGLTLALTVPILGLLLFGVVGLIVGVLIGLLFGVGTIGAAFAKES